MNFNQNYKAIEKLWKRKFRGIVKKGDGAYFSSEMQQLKTTLQNKDYSNAISAVKCLFNYFENIIANSQRPLYSLRKYASKMVDHLWDLESILEKEFKQPSGAVVYVY